MRPKPVKVIILLSANCTRVVDCVAGVHRRELVREHPRPSSPPRKARAVNALAQVGRRGDTNLEINAAVNGPPVTAAPVSLLCCDK